MTNKITKIACIILSILYASDGMTQTTTINYLTSGLSTSACNVFNPAVSVNGVTHSSLAGGVEFNSSNGILVPTIPSGSSAGGTAYIIQYNFMPGIDYNISITAVGDNALYLKTSVVPNLNQFTTSSTTSCTPDAYVTGYSTVGYGQLSTTTSTSSTTYNVPQFNISGSTAYPYLIIWAVGGLSNLSLDALTISQVVITKTPDLVLSPTSLSITCGATTPQTFTVSNPNNVQNITSYEWNLGSSSNGWLYNGSAAPQNISTTSNSITLTPDCASTLSSVSVTVRVNNQDYKTYNCSVSMTSPDMSIDGVSSFCSGTSSSYSISGLTCDGTVTWSASPSGIVTINSPSSTQTTLTKITNGEIVLTATITTACSGSNIIVQKTVDIGTPGVDGVATNTYYVDDTFALVLYPDAYNLACTNYFVNTNMHIIGATSTATWSKISSSGGTVIWTASNNNLHMEIKSTGGTALFQITASNSCGNTVQEYEWLASDCSGEYRLAYKVSPNPASNSFTVIPDIVSPSPDETSDATIVHNDSTARSLTGTTATSTMNKITAPANTAIETDKRVIKNIQLFDVWGKLLKNLQYASTKQAIVDVSDLANGVYFINISNGERTVLKKIIVQH